MVSPKHHDWAAFEMLHFSVLDFYFLQAKIFLLKNGFLNCFLNEDSSISPMIFHSQTRIERTLGEKRTVMHNNFTFHEKKYLALYIAFLKKN